MAISTKLAYQGIILQKYPDLVKRYTRELCFNCHFAALGREGCGKDLLPVDLEGNPCLYHTNTQTDGAQRRDPYKVLMGRW